MKNPIVVSGLGLVGDFGIGKTDFCDFLLHKIEQKKIRDFKFDDHVDMVALRRADDNSCFATVAARLAIENAQFNMETISAERRGLILGTTHGPLHYSMQYHRDLVMSGPQMASPTLFSNSTLNSMVSYISNILQIRGYTTTITGYNAVLQAIRYGTALISEGILDVCLVGGVDIFHDILKEGYSHCLDGSLQAQDRFGGSGILVLEPFESARKRNAEIYGQILGTEIVTADYARSAKNNISPVSRLLNRLKYKQNDIDCALTSCCNSKESKKRQTLYLKDLGKDVPVADCSLLFGHTFSAAEVFKVALGALSLKGDFTMSGIYKTFSEKRPIGNILIASVTKMGSNGCLLLGRI